jgi:dienelactone hydrolase
MESPSSTSARSPKSRCSAKAFGACYRSSVTDDLLVAPEPRCPVLTLTADRVDALGVSRDALLQFTLGPDSKRRLEPMLTSRGFDLTRTVHVIVLAGGEGIVLTQ